MFKKLLKYDLRTVAKLWWIGPAVSVIAAIIGALLVRFFNDVVEKTPNNFFVDLFSLFATLACILCVSAILISFAFTMVLVFVRFYKHLFTDEGYLTFTLPAKRKTILLSKTVNATIWLTSHAVIIFFSIILFILLATPLEKGDFLINFSFFVDVWDILKFLWEVLFGVWLVVYILEIILISFIYLIFSMVLIHFCITFGSVLVKKAKLLMSVGFYYVFNSILAAIGQVGIFLGQFILIDGLIILTESASEHLVFAIFALFFIGVAAAIATVTALLYSATQYMIERRLNLA